MTFDLLKMIFLPPAYIYIYIYIYTYIISNLPEESNLLTQNANACKRCVMFSVV